MKPEYKDKRRIENAQNPISHGKCAEFWVILTALFNNLTQNYSITDMFYINS